MAVVTINSAKALVPALKKAAPGDVILLEPGIYSGLVLRSLDLGGVTIQSKDPARPAVFADLFVRDSSGITFRNLEFAVDPAKILYSFQIFGSKDIHLDRLSVHGTLNDNPADDKIGLMIRQSENVSVTNSTFQQLWHAISFLDSRGLDILGNDFHDLRTDGVRGGGTSDITISGNRFSDFYPADGDHPDAIQFWTTHTTAPAGKIVITDNIIVRGEGEAVQGIFLRDQVGNLPFQDVTIANNKVVGGMYNGIAVLGAVDVQITGNLVQALPDQGSRIRVQNSSSVLVEKNEAPLFLYINNQDVTDRGNKSNQPDARAVTGGNGNDVLNSMRGDQDLIGGSGADQFRLSSKVISGASDTDTILDLDFAKGDKIVLYDWGSDTFLDRPGLNAMSAGASAIISSWQGIVEAARTSALVTGSRHPGQDEDLVFSVRHPTTGQVQHIVVADGWSAYFQAGGTDGL
jgi:Ca2+-binding RTX toxin-like protein